VWKTSRSDSPSLSFISVPFSTTHVITLIRPINSHSCFSQPQSIQRTGPPPANGNCVNKMVWGSESCSRKWGLRFE
jgi:hypothetical protein